MDQSGKGRKLRRILPFALAGIGLYAAIAYGTSRLDTPTHLVAQRVVPADQAITSPVDALPGFSQVPGTSALAPAQAPVSDAVGGVQAAGRDSLPAAGSVARNLNGQTTTTMPDPVSSPPASDPAVASPDPAPTTSPTTSTSNLTSLTKGLPTGLVNGVLGATGVPSMLKGVQPTVNNTPIGLANLPVIGGPTP